MAVLGKNISSYCSFEIYNTVAYGLINYIDTMHF